MPTKLLLIRHGQTEWNLKKRYCGSEDLGLNRAGEKQAEKLRKKLKSVHVNRIYTSNKKRAIQTAEVIFKKAEFEIAPGLREIHFGIFEGLTYAETMKKYRIIYQSWLNNPYKINIPKGESMPKFKKRVIGAFKKIIASNIDKTVAVVAHGGTISVFLNYILKSESFWELIPKPARLSVVEYTKGKPKLKLFSETEHF